MSLGQPSGSYWVGARPREVHRVTTSATELGHLAVAFVVLTADIVLLQYNSLGGILTGPSTRVPWAPFLALGAAAAFTGFLAHEVAHKIVAQRRGLWAEFRASPMGLLLSFVTASLGFLFAAPGATVVDGFGDLRDWGAISLAGPIVNLVEGAAFFGAFWLLAPMHGMAGLAGSMGFLAYINGWFAAFNLLPFGPLDGRKVWRWSAVAWGGAFAVAAGMALVAFYFVYFGTPG